MFLGSGCQNESNSYELAPIGEKKIFHELDVHHVYMSMSSLESARRKFFMKSMYIMTTKLESLVFGLRMPK